VIDDISPVASSSSVPSVSCKRQLPLSLLAPFNSMCFCADPVPREHLMAPFFHVNNSNINVDTDHILMLTMSTSRIEVSLR
jgi:hypothetical protein